MGYVILFSSKALALIWFYLVTAISVFWTAYLAMLLLDKIAQLTVKHVMPAVRKAYLRLKARFNAFVGEMKQRRELRKIRKEVRNLDPATLVEELSELLNTAQKSAPKAKAKPRAKSERSLRSVVLSAA